jgi:hypothetical protein
MPASLPALGSFEIHAIPGYSAEIAALGTRGLLAHGRQDLPPHSFRLPFDWHADPFGDRNWMFQLHALRVLDPYLNRLRSEPDHPEAFSAILDILADWHRANVLERAGRWTWYDMSTGLRALKLAYVIHAARLCGIDLPRPGMIDRLVALHVARLADPKELSSGNHGLFQLNGLMALAWLFPDMPGAERARSFAVTGMGRLLESQLGTEGVHTEDAPHYHFFARKKIERILDAAWWQIEAMAPVREKLARARAAEPWLADPVGRCVAIGDSREALEIRGTPSLEAWPHLRLDRHAGAIVDGYGVVRSTPEVPPDCSSMLFLTASFHAPSHKHADCMSFVWQEGGAYILVDSGKYGYQNDAMRQYFQSTRAHNTVEIDGKDFSRAARHAYGSGMRRLVPVGRSWLIEAEADRRHVGVTHRRCVFFQPASYVLAVDHILHAATDLAAITPFRGHAFTSWWHFDPSLEVEMEGPGSCRVRGLPGGRRLFVSHVTGAEEPGSRLHAGEMQPRVQGWISRSYLAYEPAPAVGFSARADEEYFAATLFEIAGADEAPRLSLQWRPETGTLAFGRDRSDGAECSSFRFGSFVLEARDSLLRDTGFRDTGAS